MTNEWAIRETRQLRSGRLNQVCFDDLYRNPNPTLGGLVSFVACPLTGTRLIDFDA